MLSPRTLLASGQLLLLAMAAFLSAGIINTWVAGFYRTRPTAPLDPPPAAAPAAKRPLSFFSVINDRDIFNPPRASEPAAAAPVSELKAKLLGTAPGAGIDSYAIIEDDAQKTQQLYRVGDTLQGRTLVKVEWDSVMLKGPRGDERLQLVEPSGKVAAPATAAAPAAGGIQQRSDTEFVIDRAEVDKQMENMNQLFTQVRAVPHFQDGKAAGFRLFAIRQDSVFEKIGLKNGDVITRINGNDLSDPARAMGLIQELRSEGHITVDMTRNRQPSTLSYEIR